MTTPDLLTTAARMVYRNRRRYRTVMIAIALGTVGFILIRTLGSSVQARVSGDLELIGEATVLTASWNDRKDPYVRGEYMLWDASKIAQIPHVVVVAPVRRTEKTRKVQARRNERERTQLYFVDERFWVTQAARVLRGRLIDAEDVRLQRKVCVIGKEIVDHFFSGMDPVGQTIRAEGYSYKVVGVFSGLASDDIAQTVFIPLSRANQHMEHTRQFVEFLVRADDWDNVADVRKQVDQILRVAHPNFAASVRVIYRASRLKRVGMIMFLINVFSYAAIIGIFLLGKVGLTNVMLSAIQDRIHEIGIRKAIGARDELIRSQFILEAVFVSVTAGLLGVSGGITAVLLLKESLQIEIAAGVMSLSILIDLAATVTLGVAAGHFPSLQASRLDIVTAMRFE